MNTDTTVGQDTHLRTAIIYKATHPSIDGVYIGCKLDTLDNYYTSSKCFDNVVNETGIKPTLEPIDTLLLDWSNSDNRQIGYQHEQEVYDLLNEMGVTLLNERRPTGYNYYVDCLGKPLTKDHRQRIGEGNKGNTNALGFKQTDSAKKKISDAHLGRSRSEETKQKIRKGQEGKPNRGHRKVISTLDGRITSACGAGRLNKSFPHYINTWIDYEPST